MGADVIPRSQREQAIAGVSRTTRGVFVPRRRQPVIAFPWDMCEGGYKLTGLTTVRVNRFEVQRGYSEPVVINDTVHTITADYSYIGWEYDLDANTAVGKNFGAAVTYETGFVRRWLYQFRLVEGRISLNRINLFGFTMNTVYADA